MAYCHSLRLGYYPDSSDGIISFGDRHAQGARSASPEVARLLLAFAASAGCAVNEVAHDAPFIAARTITNPAAAFVNRTIILEPMGDIANYES